MWLKCNIVWIKTVSQCDLVAEPEVTAIMRKRFEQITILLQSFGERISNIEGWWDERTQIEPSVKEIEDGPAISTQEESKHKHHDKTKRKRPRNRGILLMPQ